LPLHITVELQLHVLLLINKLANNPGIVYDLLHQLAQLRCCYINVASAVGSLTAAVAQVITNLSEYGNTSAASIPLALDEAVRSGKVKKGDVIACAGFGAGLSWGAAILKWGA
jgi:3-oxoacyl-[acyl-carrier-protein] synthase III